ncbi:MAG: hypothetical protein KGJ56_04975, partial [Gammaproteobacteria bacterium]|nr:hypothetical protein [Gammaproteobacteria bacterium]
GEPAENAAYVNMGTGAFLLRVCGRHPVSVPRLLAEILWQDEKRTLYAVEGTVNGAGSALDAVRQQLHVSGQRLLTQMPRWLDESHDPPVFLNGISGLGSPFWLPRFRSRFIGRAGAAEKLVAVAESILFLLCTNLERMQTGNGGIRRLVVSGGLAQWDGLCRRLASLSGLPVHRPAQHEATATGLAWLLGAGVNKADEGLIYPPAAVPGLEQRYARWRAAMRTALAGSFQGF